MPANHCPNCGYALTADLASAVRALREDCRLSQAEAARRCGVDPLTWWRWEHAQRVPSLSLRAIRRLLRRRRAAS